MLNIIEKNEMAQLLRSLVSVLKPKSVSGKAPQKSLIEEIQELRLAIDKLTTEIKNQKV